MACGETNNSVKYLDLSIITILVGNYVEKSRESAQPMCILDDVTPGVPTAYEGNNSKPYIIRFD